MVAVQDDSGTGDGFSLGKALLLAGARHLGTAAAGGSAALGVMTDQPAMSGAGALIWIVSSIMSAADKLHQQDRVTAYRLAALESRACAPCRYAMANPGAGDEYPSATNRLPNHGNVT